MIKILFCKKGFHKSNTAVKNHSHTCNEIVFYGCKSKGITQIGDKEYSFAENDIALIPSHTLHNERHFEDGGLIFFGFLSENIPPAGIYKNISAAGSIIEDIYKEMNTQAPLYENMVSHKISEILTLLFREISEKHLSGKDLSYCKHFIAENYTDKISISELAATVGYSADRFRHLFTNQYGISPQGYLIQVRLENAKRLLETSDKSCTEIAYMCGFSDSGQMSKMIKEKYKKTPLSVRRDSSHLNQILNITK